MQSASYLEQHAHTACAIVGTHHRQGVVGRIGITVGPRAAIPVRKEQDALFGIGVVGGNDVAHIKRSAIERLQFGFLLGDNGTVFFELTHQIVAAARMSIASGHTRTESALRLHKSIGTVGIEIGSRHRGIGRLRFSGILVAFSRRRASGNAESDERERYGYAKDKSFHNIIMVL